MKKTISISLIFLFLLILPIALAKEPHALYGKVNDGVGTANGATVTVSAFTMVDWSGSIGGTYPPFEYQYEVKLGIFFVP